jgi:hypothetical protein
MAGKFVVSGGNVTITFEYTVTIAKGQNIITAAAHRLWNMGYGDHGTFEVPITFDSLTNQQKLDIVDVYVKREINECAQNYYAVKASQDALVAAIADAEVNLNL